MIPMLFGEQVCKLQQTLVSVPKLTEGAFPTAWHKPQWEGAVLPLHCAIGHMLQTTIKCIFSVVAFRILARKVCVCGEGDIFSSLGLL